MRWLLRLSGWLVAACLASGTANAQGTIDVFFDIKPTSCPNPFNPPGLSPVTETVPTAVLGTDDFDTTRIVRSSLILIVPEGGGGVRAGGTIVYPISTGFEDVATPVQDPSGCGCTTEGPDGFVDLKAHFDGDDIAAALGSVFPGQEFALCIEGVLDDGSPFSGCDCIVIVGGPVSVEADTWGSAKVSYR